MRLRAPVGVVLAVALLVACCHVGVARPTQAKLPHSMKGYELYSWRVGGVWYFALLAGTNRLKTRREVSAPKTRLRGAEALKRKLDLLAEGEEVSWTTGLVPGTALPPRGVVKEVKGHCERRGITLRVSGRNPGDAANNGLHPTADTQDFMYIESPGAAGDAWR